MEDNNTNMQMSNTRERENQLASELNYTSDQTMGDKPDIQPNAFQQPSGKSTLFFYNMDYNFNHENSLLSLIFTPKL